MIALLPFLTTGRFGGVELGDPLATVVAIFGKPDKYGDLGHGNTIYRYGDVEFYFGRADILTMIYIERDRYATRFAAPNSGLDDWPLTLCMTVDDVRACLTYLAVSFNDHIIAEVFSIVAGIGIRFGFDDDQLWSICLARRA